MKTKKCNKCGALKEISNYSKHSGAKDGLRAACRPCRSVQMRSYRKNGTTTTSDMDGWTTSQLELLKNEIDCILNERIKESKKENNE